MMEVFALTALVDLIKGCQLGLDQLDLVLKKGLAETLEVDIVGGTVVAVEAPVSMKVMHVPA